MTTERPIVSTTPRTLDDLPFRRMTGGGLDEGGTTGDLAWDWDEWDDVVRKSDVAALLAEARALPLLDALDVERLGEAVFRVSTAHRKAHAGGPAIVARLGNSQDGAAAAGEFADLLAAEYAALVSGASREKGGT